jgi:outer membrane protein OmpA-like peptidoglycan-associated protein
LSWAGDESIAISTADEAKEFYALPGVLAKANASLRAVDSPVRLVAGGYTLPNTKGQVLTVVRPAYTHRGRDPVNELTTFMRLTQHECEAVATTILGKDRLTHVVFRNPEGRAVSAPSGYQGERLPALAESLAGPRPPTTVEEAADAVQGPKSKTGPGKRYGEAVHQNKPESAASARAIGVNEHARPIPGEGLAVHTIDAPLKPDGRLDKFDYSTNADLDHTWVFHHAAVVAESLDGQDQVTLENFNRRNDEERLSETILAGVKDRFAARFPDVITPILDKAAKAPQPNPAHAVEALNEIRVQLGAETKQAMADARDQYDHMRIRLEKSSVERWYFKIFSPGGAQSFHARNTDAVNRLTVVTTNVPEVTFETHSAEPTAEGVQVLEKIARSTRETEIQLVIEGHAKGGPIPLRRLARKRSDRVREELEKLGVAKDRIRTEHKSQSDIAKVIIYPADRPNRRVPGTDPKG